MCCRHAIAKQSLERAAAGPVRCALDFGPGVPAKRGRSTAEVRPLTHRKQCVAGTRLPSNRLNGPPLVRRAARWIPDRRCLLIGVAQRLRAGLSHIASDVIRAPTDEGAPGDLAERLRGKQFEMRFPFIQVNARFGEELGVCGKY